MSAESTIDTAVMNPANLVRNRRSIGVAAIASLLLLLFLIVNFGWHQAALFLVGLSAGIILYHAAFGFTAAWREIVSTGRGAGLRAQMVMLGITVLVFTPLIASGEVLGTSVRGSVAPVNMAVVCGAFMFGLGMQLGGGCASGTLSTAGSGSVRMLITLVFFIAGSLIGTWQWHMWQDVPGFAPTSLAQNFGPVAGIVISVAVFSVIYLASILWERKKHGGVVNEPNSGQTYSFLHGPWPLIAGALALVVVQVSTLLLAGRPWGVTSAFALWGAKTAGILGIDVAQWDYWQRSGPASSLGQSIFNDITSVMNIGIMLGALLAVSMAHKFSPKFKLPLGSIVAAVIGGLLLGYGARIAYGCNIGAYFSGISSTSLHGWLWFAAAFTGSTLGTRIRPLFGLS